MGVLPCTLGGVCALWRAPHSCFTVGMATLECTPVHMWTPSPQVAPAKVVVEPVVPLARPGVADEDRFEGAPLAFNTGIAEVELPASFKWKNIEVRVM